MTKHFHRSVFNYIQNEVTEAIFEIATSYFIICQYESSPLTPKARTPRHYIYNMALVEKMAVLDRYRRYRNMLKLRFSSKMSNYTKIDTRTTAIF